MAHRRCRRPVCRLALVYAAAFSALYVPFMFLLFGLFLRPVGFDYRSRLPDRSGAAGGTAPWWWAVCCRPWCLVPPLAWCCKGCRFASMRPFASTMAPLRSTGRCWLTAMGTALALLLLHGASFPVQDPGGHSRRSCPPEPLARPLASALFALGGVWLGEMAGIASRPSAISTAPSPADERGGGGAGGLVWQLCRPSGALGRACARAPAALVCALASRLGKSGLALVASGGACAAMMLTVAIALFPFVLPSSWIRPAA